MASSSITLWQIDGETMETVTGFIFLGSKTTWAPNQTVTASMKLKDACSLEGSYGKPRQHIKKQRHHFANKGPYIKTMVFPVVMYRCESWTIKKAEC